MIFGSVMSCSINFFFFFSLHTVVFTNPSENKYTQRLFSLFFQLQLHLVNYGRNNHTTVLGTRRIVEKFGFIFYLHRIQVPISTMNR